MISVIVPCYKQAEYLNECLESVYQQSYKDWECIIVNDNSPDNTEEIALEWCKKDNRFRYLKNNHRGGVSAARNSGIGISKGEWILPLDADDKIGSKYLELCYEEIKKGFNFISAKIMLFGTKNKELIHANHDILYLNNFCVSSIFEKSRWEEVGGFDEKLVDGLEDWEFWINITYNTENIKVSKIKNYTGFYYRRKEISRDTIINQSKQKFNECMEYIIKKHAKHYANNVREIQEKLILLERVNYSVTLLKKSRIIKFLNLFGILKWVSKI